MSIRTAVEQLAPKLSGYSKSRIPYTFHHDYMRMSYPAKYDSRSSVAKAFRNASDDHLYSIAFLYLMDTTSGAEIAEKFSSDDTISANHVVTTAKQILYKLNH